MKKGNTIHQEQKEMVFTEASVQSVSDERKEQDIVLESDDAEEIDAEDYEVEDGEDDDDTSYEVEDDDTDDDAKKKFESCCVCHRTEEQGAKLIHMPTGLSICSDCMQKSFDSFNNCFSKFFFCWFSI